MDEAKQILFALEGDDVSKELVETEAKVIRDAVEKTAGQAGFSELFTGGKTQHFRRMLIGASTQFFQQLVSCSSDSSKALLLHKRLR